MGVDGQQGSVTANRPASPTSQIAHPVSPNCVSCLMPAAGVKGSLAYNVGTQDAIGSVTVDKKINSYDLSLKATYQLKGDVFTLQVSSNAAETEAQPAGVAAGAGMCWVAVPGQAASRQLRAASTVTGSATQSVLLLTLRLLSLRRCCCCCGAGDVEGGQPEQAGRHVSGPPAGWGSSFLPGMPQPAASQPPLSLHVLALGWQCAPVLFVDLTPYPLALPPFPLSPVPAATTLPRKRRCSTTSTPGEH